MTRSDFIYFLMLNGAPKEKAEEVAGYFDFESAKVQNKDKEMNSKAKGKRGELELAHELNRLGFSTRRGQQYNGADGSADVIGIPGLHIECKRVERGLNLEKALEQSNRDAREGEIPVVMHRRNREQWKVTMSLDDFMKIMGERL